MNVPEGKTDNNSVALTVLHVDYVSVEDTGGGILCLGDGKGHCFTMIMFYIAASIWYAVSILFGYIFNFGLHSILF